jgi:hypothetical protein
MIDINAYQPCKQVWVIETETTAAEIRERLQCFLNNNYGEKILVAELCGSAAWYGLDASHSKVLKESLEQRLVA